MDMKSDVARHIDAITGSPEIDDFFIVITSESKSYFAGKEIGPDIISALAKAIMEQEGGLSAINRMQLAIFKAKELVRQMLGDRPEDLH